MVKFCILHTPQRGSTKIRQILKGWGFQEVNRSQSPHLLIVHQATDGFAISAIDQFITDAQIYIEYTGGRRDWNVLRERAFRGTESQILRRLRTVRATRDTDAIVNALRLSDDDLSLDKIAAISLLCQGYLTVKSLQNGMASIPSVARDRIGFDSEFRFPQALVQKYRDTAEQISCSISNPDWWLRPLTEGEQGFNANLFVDELRVNWMNLGGLEADWESVELLLLRLLDAQLAGEQIAKLSLISDALVSIDRFLSA